MKPERQRRRQDEKGRKKKIGKYFLAHQTIQSEKKGREAQTFFINKTKSRKSQATKVDDDGTYIEIFLAFSSVFLLLLFFIISQHTHTHRHNERK